MTKAHVAPVVGELMAHFVTADRFREGLGDAFAPGFASPEKFLADLQQLPHGAFRQAYVEGHAYCQNPIPERLAELKPVPPVLSIYGSLDSKMTLEDAKLYDACPGRRP